MGRCPQGVKSQKPGTTNKYVIHISNLETHALPLEVKYWNHKYVIHGSNLETYTATLGDQILEPQIRDPHI